MPVFVGLDCGGSSSRVLALDEDGQVLFRGQAGAANLLSTPFENLKLHLSLAAEGCPKPASVCGCFAGLIGREQRLLAEKALRSVFPKCRNLRTEPDYAAAIVACGPDARACVVAGTGSIICSRTQPGWAKTGGRGPLLGDPGSASRIGREALNLHLDSEDSPVSLKNAIQSVYRTVEAADIIQQVYGSASPAATLAKLAAPLGRAAASGEDWAEGIVQREMAALAGLLARHLSHYAGSGHRIGLAGGLWKSSSAYKDAFKKAAQERGIEQELFVLKKPPVEGAVALAKEMFVGN
jgi:N-acetylglucosamine kinase-like BadF-type ATPase